MSDGLKCSSLPISNARIPLMAPSPLKTTRAPAVDDRFSVPLRGVEVDLETRCSHYDDSRDVIALRFACCNTYYPCFKCHQATTEHPSLRWPKDRRDEPAVLCGACGSTMTAAAYLHGDHTCEECGTAFNPGCIDHHDRYFAIS